MLMFATVHREVANLNLATLPRRHLFPTILKAPMARRLIRVGPISTPTRAHLAVVEAEAEVVEVVSEEVEAAAALNNWLKCWQLAVAG